MTRCPSPHVAGDAAECGCQGQALESVWLFSILPSRPPLLFISCEP